MAAASPRTPATAFDELEAFVFHTDSFTADKVPRKLRAEEVAQFIVTRVDRNANAKALRQAEKVIAFYDLQEVSEHLKQLLTDQTLINDLPRAIPLDRALAAVGQPADTKLAARYYEQLVPRTSSYEDLLGLTSLYTELGGAVTADSLQSQIAARRGALVADQAQDYAAKSTAAKLEELANLRVPRASKANLAKESILNNRDRHARIHEEIEIYLQMRSSYIEILQPWAAARLRREAWAPQPEQQVVRNDNSNGRMELVSAFKSVEAELPGIKSLPGKSLPSVRVRILRAVEFFGGTLSREERGFVDKNAGMQSDVLSNE